MKKILLSVTGLMLISSLAAVDVQTTIKVENTINSMLMMQKSKEGQKLAGEIQKEIEDFQQFAKNEQKKLTDFQEEVSKKAKANVLSKDALTEKGEKLASMKKNAERILGDKEESLKASIQKRQVALHNKQMKVAEDVFKRKGCGVVFDVATPGLVYASKESDLTDDVLKSVDAVYEKESVKTVATKETKKGADVKGA